MPAAKGPSERPSQIEARDFDSNRNSGSGEGARLLNDDVDIWNEAAEGILERDRRRMKRELQRSISFICSVLSCLCAGSITAYSLYGGRFLVDLAYTQLQVNGVSIAAELAMYLPVPFFGYLCDRYSPPPLSLLASLLFGSGYMLAAFTYKNGLPDKNGDRHGWAFGVMVFAFILVGMGTSCMYLSAVATCAKNFGKGKYRGLLLAIPIAAFGLSGMWQSQVGAHLLYIRGPNGEKGEVDVFKYFLFLAGTLFGVGLLGTLGLRIVGEEEMIEEAVEELERSGLLEESQFFRPRSKHTDTTFANGNANQSRSYGTLERDGNNDDSLSTVSAELSSSTLLANSSHEKALKSWLLNHETRRFLADPTMWYLAAGFFLVTGPGEAYINNLGTIIPTLTPPGWTGHNPPAGTASTHVSIVAVTSTIARILTGALSDIFAPRADSSPNKILDRDAEESPQDISHTTSSPHNPSATSPTSSPAERSHRPFTLSRPTLLLITTFLLLLSFLTLSFPFLLPPHPPLFHLSSSLLGLGYGAIFSLVPIVISVVWGVENFATNWGVVAMMPAGGAAVWGVVYSVGYEGGGGGEGNGGLCHGWRCFGPWAIGCLASVAVAGGLFWGAGRGWKSRGIVV
ncbi:MAG: hypothetical protein Q9227_009381 [Pyrenula ochraceoflavens]